MISARERLASSTLDYYPLSRLAAAGMGDPNRLPMTIKILLEGLLRQAEAGEVSDASLRALTRWPEAAPDDAELPYLPSRILLQDFTGVPAVVDLAAMRSAMQRAGKDAGRIDPLVQVDLVIDHSVQLDAFGSLGASARNIEAEAALLGQPTYLPIPVVVGVRMTGALRPGATATDLVLTLTERLRKHGVVNKFVEFCGSGLSTLSVPDRATLSNMCPEYGATSSLFPVDAQTLRYLETTGRDRELIELVERYTRAQGMFRTDESETPVFTELLELDLGAVEPGVAGPKRPQHRVPLPSAWQCFTSAFAVDDKPTNNDVARFDFEGGATEAVGRPGSGTAVMARPAQRVDRKS